MLTIQELYAPINKFSRPGIRLKSVKGIVLHYTASPDAPAVNIAKYFKNLANQNPTDDVADRYAGAHFSLDTKSIYISIPENELGYHVGAKSYKSEALRKLSSYPNNCTIGIEMCVDKDGKIEEATFQNAADLAAHLCKKYGLGIDDLWQHYDITGKLCPLPWIQKPSEWARFKDEVAKRLKPAIVSETVKPSAPVSNASTHTVVRGDTLYGLSRTYNVSVANIKSFNGLKSDEIVVGQVLKLKVASPVKPVAPKPVAPKPVAPKPVAPKPVAPKPVAPKSTTHKVVSGDTLSEIAVKYKTTVANLKSFNNLKTDLLQIGQVLRLTKPAAPAAPTTHKVVRGDTLSEIAVKYKTTVAKLQSLNKLRTTVIQLGQVIKVK